MTTDALDFGAYLTIRHNLLKPPDDLYGDLFPCEIVMRYDGDIQYHKPSGKLGVTKYSITAFTNRAELEAHDPKSALPAIQAARARVRPS